MAIQQGNPNTGYRDPMKAMTIKALQDRQKAAAAATATSMQAPQQIASPWQGLSHLTGVLGAEYAQNKADSAEADARSRLAALKAQINPDTGATQQQIADMSVLDPEFADKEYARAMAERAAVRDREDQQQAAADLQANQQTFTSGERKAGEAFTAGQHEDTQAEAVTTATTENERRVAAAKEAAATTAAQAEQTAGLSTEIAKLDMGLKNGTISQADYDQQKQLLVDRQKAEAASAMPATMVDLTPEQKEALHIPQEISAQRNSKTNELVVGDYPPSTPAQTAFDAAAGKDIMAWDAGDKSVAQSALLKVSQAMKTIQPATGSTLDKWAEAAGLGQTGWLAGQMPDVAQYAFQPKMMQARDDIRGAVQDTLRATLGSQFTENEGKTMMDRAFSVSKRPEENIQNARAILMRLQSAYDQKEAMAQYYHEHNGDMRNFKPTGKSLEQIKLEMANMFPEEQLASP